MRSSLVRRAAGVSGNAFAGNAPAVASLRVGSPIMAEASSIGRAGGIGMKARAAMSRTSPGRFGGSGTEASGEAASSAGAASFGAIAAVCAAAASAGAGAGERRVRPREGSGAAKARTPRVPASSPLEGT